METAEKVFLILFAIFIFATFYCIDEFNKAPKTYIIIGDYVEVWLSEKAKIWFGASCVCLLIAIACFLMFCWLSKSEYPCAVYQLSLIHI